jgi:hypothetical protein
METLVDRELAHIAQVMRRTTQCAFLRLRPSTNLTTPSRAQQSLARTLCRIHSSTNRENASFTAGSDA